MISFFSQETILDNDFGGTVEVETPDTDGAGAATEDPEAERRREEARQRQGAVLRDKTLACAKQVREIQVKMTAGVEDLSKARAECLLVKKAILLKKQELTVLLEEEIRVLEIEALLQKKVSGLEEARTVSWMGCADGMTSLAGYLTNTPVFPGGGRAWGAAGQGGRQGGHGQSQTGCVQRGPCEALLSGSQGGQAAG